MKSFSSKIPTEAPSSHQLRAAARSLGLDLPDNQLSGYRSLVASFLSAFREVESSSSSTTDKAALLDDDRSPGSAIRGRNFWRPDVNPGNAWVTRCQISSSAAGIMGPLSGKRVVVKDNIAVAGLPMTCGSELLRGAVPDSDATVVSRVLRAGGLVLGKATCEEFCFSGGSHTGYPGPVPNPHNASLTAGGSSSGCGYLLAISGGKNSGNNSTRVDLALATDQGGSARTPAAWCGVVGLKPTFGLVPYTGAVSMCRRLDHIGLMARTVADVALLLAVVAGPDGLDGRQFDIGNETLMKAMPTTKLTGDLTKYRFALLDEGFSGKDAEVDAAVRDAASRIIEASMGVSYGGEKSVRVLSAPRHRRAHRFVSCLALLEGFEQRRYSTPGREVHWPSLWPTNAAASLAASSLDVTSRRRLANLCINFANQLRLDYDSKFDNVDANERIDFLIMPTLPFRPPALPTTSASVGATFAAAFGMMGNTQPFCATGHPAVSVNCGYVVNNGDDREGAGRLPVGLMLVARRCDDWRLMDAAHGVELLLGRFRP